MTMLNKRWYQVALRRILAMAIVWFLAFGSTPRVWSGDDSDGDIARRIVIGEIEKWANRHAEEGKQDTRLVIDVFKDSSAGLSPPEIGAIYESAYRKRANDLKGDWRHFIEVRGGWVASAILAAAFFFHDAVKKSAGRLWDAAVAQIFRWFARAGFAQRRALKDHRADAQKKHRRLLIPFRRQRPLDLRKVFVPLALHAGPPTVAPIDAVKAFRTHRRIMVLGAPGSGKSVLVKRLMLHYGEGGFARFARSPLAVLIELRRFNELDLDEFSVREQILEELKRSVVKSPEPLLDGAIDRNSLILLFDGLDEVDSDRRKNIGDKIAGFLEQHVGCGVVITCRTQVYDHELDREFDKVCETVLEIQEFGDAQIRQFLDSWQDQMPEGKSADQLMAVLADRPRILALARNPLLLTIVTYLYADKDVILPHSRAEFYERATFILLEEWHVDRNKFRASDKLAVLRQLALAHQRRKTAKGHDRLAVLADEMLALIECIMPNLNNLPIGAKPRDLLDEIVKRSGLILSVDGGHRYQFAHLTLQEFFAADALRDDFDQMIKSFRQDRDRWRESVKLWCGLSNDATPMIRSLLPVEPFTALESLADAKWVDEIVASDLISKLKTSIGEAAVRTEAAQAFGALASRAGGTRGDAAFKFLIATINTAGCEIGCQLRAGAISALAATNLPGAAEELAKIYRSYDEEVRASMTRLGDLAAPALARLAQRGLWTSFEDLQRIGTLRAAESLVELLASDDEIVCHHAAWHLATFFARTDISQRLRESVVAPRFAASVGAWGWVWRPFEEDPSSPLIEIVARMAELINTTPNDIASTLSDVIKQIDQRLAISILVYNADVFQPPSHEWRASHGLLHALRVLFGGESKLVAEPQIAVAGNVIRKWTEDTQIVGRSEKEELNRRRLSEFKEEILDHFPKDQKLLHTLIRLCSLETMHIVLKIMNAESSNILKRKYVEQFYENEYAPLRSIDTWLIIIFQMFGGASVFITLLFLDISQPDGPFLFGVQTSFYVILSGAMVGLLLVQLHRIFSDKSDDWIGKNFLLSLFSICAVSGFLAALALLILILYDVIWNYRDPNKLTSYDVGAAVYLSGAFLLCGLCQLTFWAYCYHFMNSQRMGVVAVVMGVVLTIVMISHSSMIRRSLRSENPFRGEFARAN
jgi:hypothetical protein